MKRPSFFPFPPAFFLPWCQSVKQTSRQAEISPKPVSYLFKEVWILEWGARPRWNRHLRVFIKLHISLLIFVTTTDHEKGSCPSFFHFNCGTMKKDYQNDLHELSVWTHYMTGKSCMYLWLVLINRWETLRLWVRRPCPTKSAQENCGATSPVESHRTGQCYQQLHYSQTRNTEEGEKEGERIDG